MTKPTSQEWFLDVNGKETGPYSLDQVLGLYREGEIPPSQRVTGEKLKGKWITVKELSDALAKESDTDPTHVLLDALQATRDRKPTAAPSPSRQDAPQADTLGLAQKPLILVGLLVILVGCFWMLWATLHSTSSPTVPQLAPAPAPRIQPAPYAPQPAPPTLQRPQGAPLRLPVPQVQIPPAVRPQPQVLPPAPQAPANDPYQNDVERQNTPAPTPSAEASPQYQPPPQYQQYYEQQQQQQNQ